MRCTLLLLQQEKKQIARNSSRTSCSVLNKFSARLCTFSMWLKAEAICMCIEQVNGINKACKAVLCGWDGIRTKKVCGR